ncbi:hypothetical protein BH769_gp68 [Gordonia phage BritBrat]|uniref:DUF1508 domain-containing protein n=1 Tax=Gordonia phage BritBrat TaxID=1838064 RepID=A0A166Y0B8_9CAUD|nr:hypothetical protein BH769_gp68 [Gordonia phage BritBrat]ANA85271.1 hypothetical protein PBI_BRITBRAT_68 [Gordonia phage BritBrat]
MIDYDSSPARYRGTIEVYAERPRVSDWNPPLPFEWRWRCKSRNGQILASGEGYRRKAGALNAIDAMFGSRPFYEYNDCHVVPWRLVIVDRHHDTTTGAVY